MKHKNTGYTRWDVNLSNRQRPLDGSEDGGKDKGPAPPPPLRPFDLHSGSLVKVYDSETFRGQWRLCEVTSISTHVVACIDLKTGTPTSFRILDYLHSDGVRKVATTDE